MSSHGLLGPLVKVSSEFWKGTSLRICHCSFREGESKRKVCHISHKLQFIKVN